MKNVGDLTSVEVLPIGTLDDEVIPWLVFALERELGTPARQGRQLAPREDWFSRDSRAISSDAVLDSMTELAEGRTDEAGSLLMLALTEIPLFALGRSVTFGQATIGGCCAVVSIAALRSPGSARWKNRLLKEAIHELGHVLGLPHCDHPACVMFPSPDLEATDAKGLGFCSACESRSRAKLPGRVRRASP